MNYLVCYYASKIKGSEYRSGNMYIDFLSKKKFKNLIISDLNQNSDYSKKFNNVKIIKSIVNDQKLIYKFGDGLIQFFWHFKVYNYLRKQKVEEVWVNNSVMPWQPFFLYFFLGTKVILGPVGGGDSYLNFNFLKKFPIAFFKELFRFFIQIIFLTLSRFLLILSFNKKKIRILARTNSAKQIWNFFGFKVKKVIPEIINPIKQDSIYFKNLHLNKVDFIWLGQNINRKRFDLAKSFFNKISNKKLNAHLHVFGIEGKSNKKITFYGWQDNLNLKQKFDRAILLNFSFREGMPSSIIESVRNGYLILSSKVGSIEYIDYDWLYLFFIKEIEINNFDFEKIILIIKKYYSSSKIDLKEIDFSKLLNKFLNEK